MGIRFFCPNGHRLNVKSFLAGKRGVCPDCGVRVNIPMESDARAVSSKKQKSANGAASGVNGNHHDSVAVLDEPQPQPAPNSSASRIPVHNDFALPAALVMPAPTASTAAAMAPVTPAPAQAAPVVAAPPATSAPVAAPVVASPATAASVPVGAAVTSAVVSPAAPAAPAVPGPADPIAEAPMAVWYVRPPSGGQYGPARGDIMQKWVGEGRVTADSLVWREGWPDWRNASKVFPSLGPGSGSTASGGAIPVVAESPRRALRPQRKSSAATGVAIVLMLGLVCLGLFAALIYVLMNTGSATT